MNANTENFNKVTTGNTEEQKGQIRNCEINILKILLGKDSLNTWKINLYQNDGQRKVERRMARDPKQTTSSVKYGVVKVLCLSIYELCHWCLLMCSRINSVVYKGLPSAPIQPNAAKLKDGASQYRWSQNMLRKQSQIFSRIAEFPTLFYVCATKSASPATTEHMLKYMYVCAYI